MEPIEHLTDDILEVIQENKRAKKCIKQSKIIKS